MNKSERSLSQRAKLLAVNSALTNFGAAVTQFVVAPIILIGLGVELFGVWSVIRQFVSYLAVADLKPFSSLKLTIGLRQHLDDEKAKQKQIGAALVVWLVSAPFLIIASIAFIFLLAPLLLDIPQQSLLQAQWAMGIVLLGGVFGTFFALPSSVLRALNLDYKWTGLQAAITIAAGLASALVIWYGWGIIGLAIITCAAPLVLGLVQLALVQKYVPWFGFSRPNRAGIISNIQTNSWLLANSLAYVLLFGLDVLIVSFILSPESAGRYAFAIALNRALFDMAAQMISAATPGITPLFGKGERSRLIAIRKELFLIALSVIVIGGACYILAGQDFLRIWSQERILISKELLVALFLVGATQFLFRMEKTWTDLALEFRPVVFASIISGFASIIFACVGAHYAGEVGIVAGFVAARIGMLGFLYSRTPRILSIHWLDLWRPAVRPLIGATLLLICVGFLPRLSEPTLVSLIVKTALFAVAITVIWSGIILAAKDRRQLLGRAFNWHQRNTQA